MKLISVIVLVCLFATSSFGVTDASSSIVHVSSAYSSLKAIYRYVSFAMDVYRAFASAADSIRQFVNGNFRQSFISLAHAIYYIGEFTGINTKLENFLRETIKQLFGSELAAKDRLKILNTVLYVATDVLLFAEYTFPEAAPAIELVRIVLAMMQTGVQWLTPDSPDIESSKWIK